MLPTPIRPALLPESVRAATGSDARDLAVAAEAALAGGRAALKFYRAEGLAIDRSGRGPVTDADRASHHAILAGLAGLAPGEAVRSEEEGADTAGGRDGRLWIVDPLDGTREFIAGIDEFSVMVGLAMDGRAVLGAVYQPASERMFLGVAAGGAWVVEREQARPLRVADGAPPKLRMIESRSHPDERLARLAEKLGEIEIVRSGSAGTKCAKVALGEADFYVHPVPHLREWDTCAGEAVARGAGARVTDCHGAPLLYGKTDPAHPDGIFVAPPAVWERIRSAVAAVAAD